ncbi:MAG: diacylglycerol/lipid kinase family protein [Mycobacteriales bacterium]
MRALLIINPVATATRARGREDLIASLGGLLELDVAHTGHRGHAESLSRQAAANSLDLVVAVGGDGTVNEVVNGLLGDQSAPDPPAFGVVPEGNANVFARALGVSPDPGTATGQLLDALRAGRRRPVGLGRADDRWFTFCAGFGLDAEVVREVERRRAAGTPASSSLFVRAAVCQFLATRTRRAPPITLEQPNAAPAGPFCLGIVSNSRPWTYLGNRPVVASPAAGFATGLDLLAARRLGALTTASTLVRMLTPHGRPAANRFMLGLHDLHEFTLAANEPLAAQLDGEYVGNRRSLRFQAVPGALSVVH